MGLLQHGQLFRNTNYFLLLKSVNIFHMKQRPERQPWQLHAKDFTKKRVYAKQDWRFQMFFEYLRISPSYLLAVETDERTLIERLGDAERATAIWKTRNEIGNVYEALYKEWWLDKGLELFGVHARKPKIELINRLSPLTDDIDLLQCSTEKIKDYLTDQYAHQARPDSVLLSIPLGQKRTATIKQLKKLLAEIEKETPPHLPIATYQVLNNKMQYRRLLAGLRLMYMRARRPDEELWRIATRAKISHSHGRLDPNGPKKDLKNAEGRKILTIMASRLLHDTLTIAENAATGIFPSLKPIDTQLFDAEKLGKQLKKTIVWEKRRKAEVTASLANN
jgi:hypothetical protein